MSDGQTMIRRLLEPFDAAEALELLVIEPEVIRAEGDAVPRAMLAMALNVALFADLIRRVPTGAAYVAEVSAAGGRVTFDHGALRTIRFADGPTGALPPGEQAFKRLLEPLGYQLAGTYPLDRLKMTGRAYAHVDFPEAIPQFFVSELHVERFSEEFAAAARRVFGSSRDPISERTRRAIAVLADQGSLSFAEAAAALPELVAAFDRLHDVPSFDDYQLLLAESAEAAWIATEGNAFNHATDRVADVEALAAAQKAAGRPMKEAVEVSTNGRVRQTAFRADPVEREFRQEDGDTERRVVPGSFYEFITRDRDEGGRLDLTFDSGNAQGIFAMTRKDSSIRRA